MKPAPDPAANARRFDRNFHDVDPVSGRVFSGGHPDAVWLIAIIYSLVAVGSAIPALITIFGKNPTDTRLVLGAMAAAVLLVPPIFLLFRREPIVVPWMVVLLVLSLAGAWAAVDQMRETGLSLPMLAGLLALLFGQGTATAYVLGMRRDGLLPGRLQGRAKTLPTSHPPSPAPTKAR